jgi:hypothetical protein
MFKCKKQEKIGLLGQQHTSAQSKESTDTALAAKHYSTSAGGLQR